MAVTSVFLSILADVVTGNKTGYAEAYHCNQLDYVHGSALLSKDPPRSFYVVRGSQLPLLQSSQGVPSRKGLTAYRVLVAPEGHNNNRKRVLQVV